jgi:hypothetical protein
MSFEDAKHSKQSDGANGAIFHDLVQIFHDFRLRTFCRGLICLTSLFGSNQPPCRAAVQLATIATLLFSLRKVRFLFRLLI